MLTSKQRAKLRALASTVEPVFQIGKGNLTETHINELEAVLSKRELIKITVLKGSDYTADELLTELCEALEAEPVAAIGNKAIIYRRSSNKSVKHIEI